tara:strand:- start:443 stop:1063 length:621 start_codon:yes stop_codon:yes gene_type:complete
MSSDNYFVKEADNYYRRKLNTYQYTINSNNASGPTNNPGQFEFDIPPFPFPTHQRSKLAIFRLKGFQVINQGNVDAQRVSGTINSDLSGFMVRLSGLGTRGQLLNNQETNAPAKLLPKPEFFVLNKYADVLEGTGVHEARQQLQVHSGSDDDLDYCVVVSNPSGTHISVEIRDVVNNTIIPVGTNYFSVLTFEIEVIDPEVSSGQF